MYLFKKIFRLKNFKNVQIARIASGFHISCLPNWVLLGIIRRPYNGKIVSLVFIVFNTFRPRPILCFWPLTYHLLFSSLCVWVCNGHDFRLTDFLYLRLFVPYYWTIRTFRTVVPWTQSAQNRQKFCRIGLIRRSIRIYISYQCKEKQHCNH